ncbi:MAG: hypothetical protein BGO39_09465 [Chloroflexi bacterium 54-19]|nr:MAG: hypothetical protein BGO39_09465 [Chloroflexi bacterium 54-19]
MNKTGQTRQLGEFANLPVRWQTRPASLAAATNKGGLSKEFTFSHKVARRKYKLSTVTTLPFTCQFF